MSELFCLRLDGIITLRSPLSHIGESAGPDAFLSQDLIVGPDGDPVECFTYSGNAFRGMLRDLAAADFLDTLALGPITLPSFYLLFSGGALTSGTSLDLNQARALRAALPLISLLGGAVGSQILPGKLRVGAMYPLAAECLRVLPESLRRADLPSWRRLTFDKSYTRTDDARNPLMAAYRSDEPAMKAENPQQMRYTVELLASGAELYQRIDFVQVTEAELGVFVAAMARYSDSPYLGGKGGTGHGLADIRYDIHVVGDNEHFLTVSEEGIELSQVANRALTVYREQISELRAAIETRTVAAPVAALLGGGA